MKRVLLILTGTLLALFLTACGGIPKITDGIYYSNEDEWAVYSSIEFNNGNFTRTFRSTGGSQTYSYTIVNDKKHGYGLFLALEGFDFDYYKKEGIPNSSSYMEQISKVEEDTIKLAFMAGTYYRQK